ncbi:MAG: ArsS family sensor histidine kinase [Arcobacteraceae bacterium]
MNKNSIFFTITLFFLVMIIVTYIIIFMGYNIKQKEQIELHVSKYKTVLHRITKTLLDDHRLSLMENKNMDDFSKLPPPPRFDEVQLLLNDEVIGENLKSYDLELSDFSYENLNSESIVLGAEDNWKLFEYEGYKYFYIDDKFRKYIIKDTQVSNKNTEMMIYLTILLNVVFISFYIFLIKKLQPLNRLKKDIVKFSNGDLDIDTSCVGVDEISEVSNEFNNAIIQIQQLTNSRNLFLRNIMHELKTPITKGLLISNMLDEGKFKNGLKKAFFRLEYLLNEFARIEEFTSQNMQLNKEQFRLIDILDHSLDILLSDSDAVDLEVVENIVVEVDFELFALAIKNLLDNAMKYGVGKPQVTIQKDMIIIKNKGEEVLSLPLEEYNKPFNKSYENSNNGLGLGLYIVNHILKAHNLEFSYLYENDENIFIIKFPSV